MRNSLRVKRLLAFCLFLQAAPLFAQEETWAFLPVAPLFQPLVGDPREPHTGVIAYTSQSRFEGAIGARVEMLRYLPPDQTQWSFGFFGSGFIWLDENGATFPMRDSDWYAGLYFTEISGPLSYRLQAVHQSSHLGDSLEGLQDPLLYNGEYMDLTASFQPSDDLRFYAGLGAWLNLEPPDKTFFATLGAEIYTPAMDLGGTLLRGYGTVHLKWKDQAGGALNKTAQWGLQWKFKKEETRALRLALVYYNGNYEFGQFYQDPDDHLGIGVYFDP